MQQLSYKSITRAFGFLLILALNFNCRKDDLTVNPIQTNPSSLSTDGSQIDAAAITQIQTRTANLFNNWGESFLDLWYQAGPQYISADDDSYAYSKRLSRGRGSLALLLQDFRFDIPPDATIQSIVVIVRRFKQGRGSIGDSFVSLVRQLGVNPRNQYGVRFTDPNYYPDSETEVIYRQNGTGNDGGLISDQFYQWTPGMINDPAFGVWIGNLNPTGSVVVYYDLVEIIVGYEDPNE